MRNLLILSALFWLTATAHADTITINFEGVPDSTPVRDLYKDLGVRFVGAVVLSAGVSLNEFEFPPYSGSNVAFDAVGPITLNFDIPTFTFAAYFTHLVPLSIIAFDQANNNVAGVNSLFTNNLALSGQPGTYPNELLRLAYGGGISRIVISGSPSGSSFAMDDVSFSTAPVPEPSTFVLLATGLLAGMFGRRARALRLGR